MVRWREKPASPLRLLIDEKSDIFQDQNREPWKKPNFFNLYNHGLIRVAVGIPEVQVADPAFNGSRTIELMEKAERDKAVLALFPELGLSAYSCEDLFHQQALLEGSSGVACGDLEGV